MDEYATIDTFAEFLVDDERESFTFAQAERVSDDLKVHVSVVIRGLKSYGLAMEAREPAKRVRGFRTSSNDRWFGPGSSRSHGGSGYEQICGWAGQKG